MIEERYSKGDVIFEAFAEDDASLNFILNGRVMVELWPPADTSTPAGLPSIPQSFSRDEADD